MERNRLKDYTPTSAIELGARQEVVKKFNCKGINQTTQIKFTKHVQIKFDSTNID
jgi:hypothetical protein